MSAEAIAPLSLLLVHVDTRSGDGSSGGIEAMNAVAAQLRRLRPGDGWLYRFGVEELMAVLDGADREAADRFAQELRKSLQERPRFGGAL